MDPDPAEPVASPHFIHWWWSQLPPALESRFVAETGAEQNRQIQFWVVAWLVFSWLTFILDIIVMPELWRLALGLRLFVVTPAAAGSFWLLSHVKHRWLISLASVSVPIASLLSVLALFAVASDFDTFRSGMILVLGILWTNVLIPIRLRDAIIFTMLALAGGEAINTAGAMAHHATDRHLDMVVAGLGVGVMSISARFLAERTSRSSFLAGLKLQSRNEQLERANTSLLEMSNTDPLTGLANRRFFDAALIQTWATASAARSWIAAMMIDVDQFKMFNDAAGHLEGDRCLTVVARAIAEHIRIGYDLPARFGGEEFIVMMPATGPREAHEIAQRVHSAIGAMRVFHPGRVGEGFVSVSIGCAALHLDVPGLRPTDLLAAADEALYAAKAAGRNQVMQAGII